MARLEPIAEKLLTPAMRTLVDKVRFDPAYVTGLKVFAHNQEFVQPMWAASRTGSISPMLDVPMTFPASDRTRYGWPECTGT